ncbi:maleylpyruvate isomerase family mycothiol-dependent enzyme [Phytoactinopolyspora halophila]|uniref:maleylpyruvate isomerase family mycothiol-dependent enzyme n=1 Tax=Phytoactinopolyspora halophila TaxID=1981511 RepID=UPI0013148EA8|nr:maleylpyruvate isomerase family mycothiol-dependent enzyme [Phytoactinopolyspora halophila]
MAKRSDPGTAWSAYREAHEELRTWLDGLPDTAWPRQSCLPGWTVAELAAHIASVADSVVAVKAASRESTAKSIGEYLAAYAPAADVIAGRAREAAESAAHEPSALLQTIDERFASAAEHVEELGLRDRVVEGRRGPIRLGDFLLTRVIEIVVHGDDFARSLPESGAPRLPRAASRMAVRALLEALAERAPGRSVEVRVPPHAAVQCVEGPQHTRGTPASVVETDAATWIRLASGRVSWQEAVAEGHVSASGERADLSAYVPLL